jgi:hypothetical protein
VIDGPILGQRRLAERWTLTIDGEKPTSASSLETATKFYGQRDGRIAFRRSVAIHSLQFNHQPLDFFSASSLSLWDFSDFHHAHCPAKKAVRRTGGIVRRLPLYLNRLSGPDRPLADLLERSFRSAQGLDRGEAQRHFVSLGEGRITAAKGRPPAQRARQAACRQKAKLPPALRGRRIPGLVNQSFGPSPALGETISAYLFIIAT